LNNSQQTAALNVDGHPKSSWAFNWKYLRDNHVVSIACGPPADATAEFQQIVTKFENDTCSSNTSHNISFVELFIDDLLGSLSTLQGK